MSLPSSDMPSSDTDASVGADPAPVRGSQMERSAAHPQPHFSELSSPNCRAATRAAKGDVARCGVAGEYDTVGQHREWGKRSGAEGAVFGSEAQRVPEPAIVEGACVLFD